MHGLLFAFLAYYFFNVLLYIALAIAQGIQPTPRKVLHALTIGGLAWWTVTPK